MNKISKTPVASNKTSKTKGKFKENITARHLIQRGWTVLFQNKKVLGVELDLLAKKDGAHVLIEVKSVNKAEDLEKILKNRQKERLKQAAESLCRDLPGLRLFLAAVDSQNKIEFFEIF